MTTLTNGASPLRIGIDASNIRSGGGLTHLVELLREANPAEYSIEKVIVWASKATLDRIENRPWLAKCSTAVLEGHFLRRAMWQRNQLGGLVRSAGCNLLFVPGGSFATSFRPIVTMSRNMLPFEWREMRRYGLSAILLKLLLLRRTQSRSFREAEGLIFLTQYARDTVLKLIGSQRGITTIIPHGIDQRFFSAPRTQRKLEDFTQTAPCRVLYVSHVEQYKHQWNVAEAILKLKDCGFKIRLELLGPKGNASERLRNTLNRIDPDGKFITYRGAVSYEELHNFYAFADINVFASSCEAFGQILLEAMAAGLPIACSNRSAIPEVLGDAGIYFNPEKPAEIARAIRTLIESRKLRTKLAKAAFERARQFSWERCAEQTFTFLAKISREHPKG